MGHFVSIFFLREPDQMTFVLIQWNFLSCILAFP